MSGWHDFSVTAHKNGKLEVHDPPPVGALTAFSLKLLAEMERAVSVDRHGRLVLHVFERPYADRRRLLPTSLAFEPVSFDAGSVELGPPRSLVCRRVAP